LNLFRAVDAPAATSQKVAGNNVAGRITVYETDGVVAKTAGSIDVFVSTISGGVSSQKIAKNAEIRLSASGLIPALRYHVSQTVPGLTSIVEGMPDMAIGDGDGQLQLPFVCLIAGKPTPRDGAVQSLFVDVPVDVVLVVRQVAGDDAPQTIRLAFEPLVASVIADYKMRGFDGIPSAMDAHVLATPMERVNEYQQRFSTGGEPVVCQVLSLTFATDGWS
jgi:hypothetical protein